MNSSESQNMIISEFVGDIHIEDLHDQFVKPFEPITESVAPRRLLGNYLTYLVSEDKTTYSVMLKKERKNILPHCNCIPFQIYNKCRHIAIVLTSCETQLNA